MGKLLSNEEFLDKLYKKNIHYKNGEFEIDSEYLNCKTKLECRCLINNTHGSFMKSADELTNRNVGCPKCGTEAGAKKNRKTKEEFLNELIEKNTHYKNKKFIVIGEYINNRTPIKCKCFMHGNWYPLPDNLLRDNNGCPKCNHKSTSYPENFIRCSLINAISEVDIPLKGDRTLLSGREIDIPIYNYNIGIEYGSWIWHKDKWQKDLEKQKLAKEKNIDLIIIYDHIGKQIPDQLRDNDNIWLYEDKLYKNEEKLKKIVMKILDRIKVYNFDLNWEKISAEAFKLSSYIDHEKFLEQLKSKNEDYKNGLFYIADVYKNDSTNLKCVCSKCNYYWYATPSNLKRNRSQKKHFKMHLVDYVSIKKSINSWQKENPSKTKKDCSNDLNFSIAIINKYWQESNSVKNNLDNENIKQKIKQWQEKNPFGYQKKCAEELMIDVKKIRKFWIKQECIRHKIISDFINKNPYTSIIECANSLGWHRSTVKKYWIGKVPNGGTKPGTKINTPQKELIRSWINSHPKGTKKECINDLKLDRHTVSRNWNECHENIKYDIFAEH